MVVAEVEAVVVLVVVVVLALLGLVCPSLVVLRDLLLDLRLDRHLDLQVEGDLLDQWGRSLAGLCQTCP